MPLPAIISWGAAAAVATIVAVLRSGPADFAPGVCERVEPYLLEHLVGQDLAVRQLCDAVCDHVGAERPARPLVLSVHGPPGVGKSLLHLLLARSLYSTRPSASQRCPGPDCGGYKVFYGMDYVAAEREAQHAHMRGALLAHVRLHPQSLLVVEEYDKLDCATRGLFRQLIENPASANVSLERSIIVLESNTGYSQLHGMLVEAGDRSLVSMEAAQRALKDLVFGRWLDEACEPRADTLKSVGLVDFFLPFLPLERRHLVALFEARLRERRDAWRRAEGAELAWAPDVSDFLADRVDYDGAFPIEGAKEVATLMTRYVTRALRERTLPASGL
ncbi:hypothetical protein WJX81_001102 [Elliptochloris bilobata]|uniref:AAA+ ATPase domain-containing protein n=1 Tax=Elliptochloris bilobata TaxID=381761 RepID=A0AAW1QDE1_9CHLO